MNMPHDHHEGSLWRESGKQRESQLLGDTAQEKIERCEHAANWDV